jgi:Domain of unknown function (DUF397)
VNPSPADKHRMTWRKSRQSGASSGNCVEIANAARRVAVRDSKDPAGPVLLFDRGTWLSFAARIKQAELDL